MIFNDRTQMGDEINKITRWNTLLHAQIKYSFMANNNMQKRGEKRGERGRTRGEKGKEKGGKETEVEGEAGTAVATARRGSGGAGRSGEEKEKRGRWVGFYKNSTSMPMQRCTEGSLLRAQCAWAPRHQGAPLRPTRCRDREKGKKRKRGRREKRGKGRKGRGTTSKYIQD